MSISADPGSGIPGGKKGHPRRGTAPAEAPPPGARENTRATVTAAWSTILARIPRPARAARHSPMFRARRPFGAAPFFTGAKNFHLTGDTI